MAGLGERPDHRETGYRRVLALCWISVILATAIPSSTHRPAERQRRGSAADSNPADVSDETLFAAGGIGLAIARFGLAGIMAMAPPDTIPDEALVQLNVPALLFALAVSIGSR